MPYSPHIRLCTQVKRYRQFYQSTLLLLLLFLLFSLFDIQSYPAHDVHSAANHAGGRYIYSGTKIHWRILGSWRRPGNLMQLRWLSQYKMNSSLISPRARRVITIFWRTSATCRLLRCIKARHERLRHNGNWTSERAAAAVPATEAEIQPEDWGATEACDSYYFVPLKTPMLAAFVMHRRIVLNMSHLCESMRNSVNILQQSYARWVYINNISLFIFY